MPFTVTTKGRLGISRKKDFQAVIKAGAMGVEGGGQSSGELKWRKRRRDQVIGVINRGLKESY